MLDNVKVEEKWRKDAKGNKPNKDKAFSGMRAKGAKLTLGTPNTAPDYESDHEAMMMAKKALEQEPCEDAISRQSMLDYLKYLHGEMPEEEFIKELPSVTPARKTGHWIYHSDEGFVECSNCGSATNCDGNIADLHFCFSCGAKMDEDEHPLKYADQDTMMPAT